MASKSSPSTFAARDVDAPRKAQSPAIAPVAEQSAVRSDSCRLQQCDDVLHDRDESIAVGGRADTPCLGRTSKIVSGTGRPRSRNASEPSSKSQRPPVLLLTFRPSSPAVGGVFAVSETDAAMAMSRSLSSATVIVTSPRSGFPRTLDVIHHEHARRRTTTSGPPRRASAVGEKRFEAHILSSFQRRDRSVTLNGSGAYPIVIPPAGHAASCLTIDGE